MIMNINIYSENNMFSSPKVSKLPWIEKYRPEKISDLKQSQGIVSLLKNNIATGNITHYILYGKPGTGKTSAIMAVGKEIFREHYADRVIEFNAADDRGISAVRDKITYVARRSVHEIKCSDGHIIPAYKIIILDEADAMTSEAQDALRVIIEKYSSVTRFCFICNYFSKITDAIKSRCSTIHFKTIDKNLMVENLDAISKKESMVLTKKVLESIIKISNGDMRRAIMLLQNIKYRYEYIEDSNTNIQNLSCDKIVNILPMADRPKAITVDDVYELAASVSINWASKKIKQIKKCQTVLDVYRICQDIHTTGIPPDAIISQLYESILVSGILTDQQKTAIIYHMSSVMYKLKESSDGYIQLMYFTSCIHGVMNDSKLFPLPNY